MFMKNFNIGVILAIFCLSLVAFTCQKEDSVLEPITKGSIRGNVIDNSTEQPIRNAVVYTSPGSIQVLTDEYGDYRMNNIEPKEYVVYCYKAGYDTVSTAINVDSSYEAQANFRLSKKDTTSESKTYGTITGLVRDLNSEIPIEKVTIKTFPATSVTLTDVSGKYTISNVTPGSYTVTAIKKDYDSSKVSIKVTAGNITEANINLTPVSAIDTTQYGRLSGKITDLNSSNPLSNVTVYTSPATSTVTTNALGDYYIRNMTPGTYKVIAEKNEYESDTTTVVIQKNLESVANLSLRASSTTLGNIKGKVFDEISNQPIGNVNIYTVPSTSSVSTNSSGEYLIGNIPAGTYKVIASKTEYFSDTTEVVVQPGMEVNADLYLRVSTGTLEGVVLRAADGGKVNRATVKTVPSTNIVFTDLTGQFLFEKLSPGEYKIITSHPEFVTDTTTVEIKAGIKTTATIVLSE